jgi:hypothetical protein
MQILLYNKVGIILNQLFATPVTKVDIRENQLFLKVDIWENQLVYCRANAKESMNKYSSQKQPYKRIHKFNTRCKGDKVGSNGGYKKIKYGYIHNSVGMDTRF